MSATISKDRLPELREFLGTHKIDIDRVMLRDLDETGYSYVKEYRDGRPMFENGQFKLLTERFTWPEGVWDRVAELLYGKAPKDVSITRTHLKSEAERLTRELGVVDKDVAEAVEAATKLSKATPKKKDK